MFGNPVLHTSHLSPTIGILIITTTCIRMPTASKGVLVRCDPSIRALILQIDLTSRGIVLQELDSTHLMIKQEMVQFVKDELNRLLLKNIYDPMDGDKQ